MKNHVWREIWPAMPDDARQYWRLVTKQVMSLYDGGGGGMKCVCVCVAPCGGGAERR